MSEASTSPEVCCPTTCGSIVSFNVPGSQGTAGVHGVNGINAFTVLTASFEQPAALANVTAEVESSAWITVGQAVFVETGGTYEVISKPSVTEVVLKNLGYTENAVVTTIIPGGAEVSAAGLKGDTGATGAAGGANTFALSTINAAGNVDVTIGATATEHSLMATVDAGAGIYTATYSLKLTNAAAGDIINILFLLPASTNPTVEVHDDVAGGTLLFTYTSLIGGADVAFRGVYDGAAWVKLNANAVI